MARGPDKEMAWGCTTRAVGRPIICARTAGSSGKEARAPLKADTTRQMARRARPGNQEMPFKCRNADFGFCTLFSQRRVQTVKWSDSKSAGNVCSLLWFVRKSDDFFHNFCALSDSDGS